MSEETSAKPARRPRKSVPDSTPEPVPLTSVEEIEALRQQGDTAAANRLLLVTKSTDKTLVKAARRALFLLKQAGVEPEAVAVLEPAAPAKSAAIAQQAFATNTGGTGKRLLIFQHQPEIGGSPWTTSYLLQYDYGVADVLCRKASAHELEEEITRLRSDERNAVAELPIDYALHLLALAITRNAEERNPIPKGYHDSLTHVGEPQATFPEPLIYDRLDAETVRNDGMLPRDSDRFVTNPLYHTWILPFPLLMPFADKLLQSQESPLALDEAQKKQRGEAVLDEATDALMDSMMRTRYREWLEENALLMLLDGREEEAKQAFYHALTLKDEIAPHTIPIARTLVSRSIFLMLSLAAREQERRNPSAAQAETALPE